MNNIIFTLSLILIAWVIFYMAANILKLQRFGLEMHPLYALYKSTKLNAFLERLGHSSPRLWRVIGDMGVVTTIGEVVFMTYILFLNLYRFVFVPERASPVVPLIPGVTIRTESLPWFLAAAGFVILVHELSHGVQCVIEDVKIRSSAVLLAIITFGGAVEPDEESMEAANGMSQMRIFASGSFTNLVTGLLLIVIFSFFGGSLPDALSTFMQWLYFLSVNLALVNMLPIYPLDGGQMMKTFVASMRGKGVILQRVAMYGFLALVASNLVLSLIRFGLIPI